VAFLYTCIYSKRTHSSSKRTHSNTGGYRTCIYSKRTHSSSKRPHSNTGGYRGIRPPFSVPVYIVREHILVVRDHILILGDTVPVYIVREHILVVREHILILGDTVAFAPLFLASEDYVCVSVCVCIYINIPRRSAHFFLPTPPPKTVFMSRTYLYIVRKHILVVREHILVLREHILVFPASEDCFHVAHVPVYACVGMGVYI